MPVLECARCNELYYSAHASTELSCDACGGRVWRVFEDEVSFARVGALPREPHRGDHAVLVYTDPEEAAGFCAGFIAEGVERGEHVITVIPPPLRSAVNELLADQAELVEAHEPSELHHDFSVREVAERFASLVRDKGGTVRLLSGPGPEQVAGVRPEEWRAFEQRSHELTLELGAVVLCVYDGRSLPIAFSPLAVETHPLISRGGRSLARNPDFAYEPAPAL